MNKPTNATPKFADEAQERAYRESHDYTDHLDGSKARKVAAATFLPPYRCGMSFTP